jgi:two-component sensor histidine kinase
VVFSRWVVLFVVVLALGIIGVLGAVSSASPKGDDDHNDSEERSTLTVSTKTAEEKVLDLGAQGLSHGDMRVVNGEVLVKIEDDGRGFGPETSYGMGLTGMRERVLVLGGELEVEGREGVGTRVFLRVRMDVLTGGETGERSNI